MLGAPVVRARGREEDNMSGRGPGGRLTPGQRPVDETTRIAIDVQLARFKASDEPELVFPPDMSNHDRAVVHAECKKLGLRSKSHGKGEARRVHVTRPKEFRPQDHEVGARRNRGHAGGERWSPPLRSRRHVPLSIDYVLGTPVLEGGA